MVEPSSIANGYDVSYKYAPAIDSPQVGVHIASYTLLLAHARAYRLYQSEFKETQQGKTIELLKLSRSMFILINLVGPEGRGYRYA